MYGITLCSYPDKDRLSLIVSVIGRADFSQLRNQKVKPRMARISVPTKARRRAFARNVGSACLYRLGSENFCCLLFL